MEDPSNPETRSFPPINGNDRPALGVDMSGPAISKEGPEWKARLFQRALAVGISLFDLTASATPLLDARLLRESERGLDHSFTLIVPLHPRRFPAPDRGDQPDQVRPPRYERSRDGVTTLPQELEKNVAVGGRLMVEIPPSADPEALPTADEANSVLALSSVASPPWVVRWDSPEQLDPAVRRARRLGDAMISGPASLLDSRGPSTLTALEGDGLRRYIARDPFAGGRLDGSLLEVGNLERNPRAGPWSIERLQEQYRPVLSFDFLTKRGSRNLRIAALQYLLTLPSVAGVVVPISNERQLEEMSRLTTAPPLDPLDLERIARLQSGSRIG
jgi:hypothetical protein